MKINHILGLIAQEFYLTLRSLELVLDLIVFPVMSVVLFGILAVYLTGTNSSQVGHMLLFGMLLWQVVFIVQYSIPVSALWNIWAKNLSNMFVAPLNLSEYITAQILSAIFKAIIIFTLSVLISNFVFHFSIFEVGLVSLAIGSLNLILFAISLGIIILGLIFRFGTKIQAIAWGLLPVFQPLTAAFYPVSVLPEPLQRIAYLLPPTYVFESLRANILNPELVRWDLLGISFGENMAYLLFAALFFNFMFNKSKETGQFARLES